LRYIVRGLEDELGQEPQLTPEGSPIAPSIDSPLASSGGWLHILAEACDSEEVNHPSIKKEVTHSSTKEEVPSWTLKEELPLDLAGTMMTKQPSLTSNGWERNGY
jgi:hypothetical protein